MPNHEKEILYSIALTLLKNVGSISSRKLITHFGSAENVFKASAKSILNIPGIGHKILKELRNKEYLLEAEKIIACCLQANIDLLIQHQTNFPYRLQRVFDSPLVLYFLGNANLNATKMVGLVGTRRATEYGRKVCNQIATESAGNDVHFVSGLAYGIDSYIHQACIEQNIPNFAVLANGFHFIYPYQHRKMADQIKENVGLISEYPPHIKPDPRHFPMRNRIIAGLVDALVVVEAAEKGGALITAEYANNYHREVFAVPGGIDKPFSVGCNQLIAAHKSNIFVGTNRFFEQLNWDKPKGTFQKKILFDSPDFTQNETAILSALHMLGDLSFDELAWKTQIPLNEIALIILNLEFNGYIKAIAGNRYSLT